MTRLKPCLERTSSREKNQSDSDVTLSNYSQMTFELAVGHGVSVLSDFGAGLGSAE